MSGLAKFPVERNEDEWRRLEKTETHLCFFRPSCFQGWPSRPWPLAGALIMLLCVFGWICEHYFQPLATYRLGMQGFNCSLCTVSTTILSITVIPSCKSKDAKLSSCCIGFSFTNNFLNHFSWQEVLKFRNNNQFLEKKQWIEIYLYKHYHIFIKVSNIRKYDKNHLKNDHAYLA